MFYSSHVLTKKGPLAKIWLAAHIQSKLTKAMVFATDISLAVHSIFHPPAPMALRLTSNLLLGVARILFRKTKYLLHDSSEALTKLKTAYRPAALPSSSRDLPPANVSFAAVTLPSSAAHLDLPAPLLDLTQLPHRARPPAHSYRAAERDITIDEFAGGLSGGILDAFATDPFAPPPPAHAHADEHDEPLVFTPSQRYTPRERAPPSVRETPRSVDALRADRSSAASAASPALSLPLSQPLSQPRDARPVDTPDRMRDAAAPAPDLPPDLSFAKTPAPLVADAPPEAGVARGEETPPRPTPAAVDVPMPDEGEDAAALSPEGARVSPAAARLSTGGDELVLAEEEVEEGEEEEMPAAVAAAAADGEVPQSADGARRKGRKRKRVLLEDDATELSVEEFRRCLNDTSDLVLHPSARRRATAKGRRPPMSYEDLLTRPTIGLAPRLRDLFAQSFSAGEAAQVGSPMSDMGGEKECREEGEGPREASPEKAVSTPPRVVKEVVADPEITPQLQEDAEAVLLSQSAENALGTQLSGKGTDEVPSSPVQDEMMPVESPDRRLSIGTDAAVPMPEDGGAFDTDARELDFGKGKISLMDVAKTRSQVVEEGRGEGEGHDVTENTISARTQKMQEYIVGHMDDDEVLHYSGKLAAEPGMSRRTAARSFYELLNLSSKKALQLSQDGPYGAIRASPLQPAFDALRSTGLQ